MSADKIQVQHEQVENIAARFGSQAEQTAQMQQRLQQCVEALRQGGWQGEGATTFLHEMEGATLPALTRLIQALEAAQTTTTKICRVLCQAEEEAARLFQSRGEAVAVTTANVQAKRYFYTSAVQEGGSQVEIIEVDEATQLLNLVEWARSMLADGNLTPEQRTELEARLREAEAALVYAEQEAGGNELYAAAGVMVVGSGALLADDITVIGIADDVLIPFVLVTAAVVGIAGLFHELTKADPDTLIHDSLVTMSSADASTAGQSEESKDFLTNNDPQDWEGMDPQDVEDLIPDDWVVSPANKGGGTKYSNPARPGEQIIIEPGWPNATDPVHGGPYIRISSGGRVIRIPLLGNPALNPPSQ